MKIRRAKASVVGLGLLGVVAGAAPAAALTVDGNLSDWNVTVNDWTSYCGTSNAGSCHSSVFSTVAAPGLGGTFIEDTNDKSNSYAVGPNSGGQNYDVEFMAVALQGSNLFVAISSGQRPDNGKSYYSPGDIRIVVNGTTKYGIEVGGGVGGLSSSSSAITEGAAGTTYNVTSSGYTNSTTPTLATAAAQTAGSIWKNVSWITDPIYNSSNPSDPNNPKTEVQFQTNGSSQQVGTADYVFTRNSSTTQHSFIELSFDLSVLLGSDQSAWSNNFLELGWAPSCGNDIGVVFEIPPQGDIPNPEPATISIMLLGLVGAARMRRRRRAA